MMMIEKYFASSCLSCGSHISNGQDEPKQVDEAEQTAAAISAKSAKKSSGIVETLSLITVFLCAIPLVLTISAITCVVCSLRRQGTKGFAKPSATAEKQTTKISAEERLKALDETLH